MLIFAPTINNNCKHVITKLMRLTLSTFNLTKRQLVLSAVCLMSALAWGQSRLLSHETEIDNIIKSMTLEEKIDMLHGKNMFSSAGVPRLGIADVEYADGPFGIREEMEPHSWNSANLTTDSATFFPTGSALAATWSTEWTARQGYDPWSCHQHTTHPHRWTNL